MTGDRGAAQDGLGGLIHACILRSFLVLALPACQGPQSMLDPAGPSAAAIAAVWWGMFGVATAVLVAVVLIWLFAMRRARVLPQDDAERIGRRWIVGGGIVLPVVSIVALLVFGSPAGRHQLPVPIPSGQAPAPLRVDATGHQWWWELHYPDSGVRLRNELRLPVGRPVDIHTGSADVIHSFWVPRLGGKLDAIPGRTLVVRLQADQEGTFRGQCAEFCGREHAHMTMVVLAMPPAEFDAWLQQQRASQGAGAGR
jgi:cytochrome c oxidase subunit 2